MRRDQNTNGAGSADIGFLSARLGPMLRKTLRSCDSFPRGPLALVDVRRVPYDRVGGYRVGADRLLVVEQGRSLITVEDLAIAMLDEA
jgi:hypothetical protein